jgi:hypothetical protein
LEDFCAFRDGSGGRWSCAALIENVSFISNFVGDNFVRVVVVYSETVSVFNLKRSSKRVGSINNNKFGGRLVMKI